MSKKNKRPNIEDYDFFGVPLTICRCCRNVGLGQITLGQTVHGLGQITSGQAVHKSYECINNL